MSETDEKPRKPGVPSWQLQPSNAPQDSREEKKNSIPQQTPSRASILEKAQKFLLEDEVRNAPTDKQVAFLESKGLESHEIQELLGVTRNTEASSTSESKQSAEASSEPSSPSSPSSSLSQSLPPHVQAARDAPPIITYPEFLITQQPPPLITAGRLLTTLYLFGGLSALLYGTSNYLVTPMVASLTSSRHDLAETTQENLEKLITRLREMVSQAPDVTSTAKEVGIEEDDSNSDPTELFHRDIGVQTSLPATPSLSRPVSPSLPTELSASQSRQLTTITSCIKEINESFISEGEDSSQLATTVNVLREYLESLAYVPPVYSFGSGGMYGAATRKKDPDDEISKVKAQIRGVKGVLLTARSFPTGAAQGKAR